MLHVLAPVASTLPTSRHSTPPAEPSPYASYRCSSQEYIPRSAYIEPVGDQFSMPAASLAMADHIEVIGCPTRIQTLSSATTDHKQYFGNSSSLPAPSTTTTTTTPGSVKHVGDLSDLPILSITTATTNQLGALGSSFGLPAPSLGTIRDGEHIGGLPVITLSPQARDSYAEDSINRSALQVQSSVISEPLSNSESPMSTSSFRDEPVIPCHASQITQQWHVPPRPKPGRRPAEDVPPTKRKAQNRIAQRAFRERRAARVGELEEELQQERDQRQLEKAQWEQERQAYQQEVDNLRGILQQWQDAAKAEQTRKAAAEYMVQQLETQVRKLSMGPCLEIPCTSQDLRSSRSSLDQNSSSSGILSQSLHTTSNVAGGLVEESKCNLSNDVDTFPKIASDSTHHRYSEQSNDEEPEPMELDFTYAKPLRHDNSNPDRSAPSAGLSWAQVESCGFCTGDGAEGICLCKELDTSPCVTRDENVTRQLPLPSSSFVPPDRELMEPSASVKGPGSCYDCLRDPVRRAFCQRLAGTIFDNTAVPTSPHSHVILPEPAKAQRESSKLGPEPNLHTPGSDRLSCADTYTALQSIYKSLPSEKQENVFRTLEVKPACGDEGKSTGCAPVSVSRASLADAILLTSMREPSHEQSRDPGKG